MKIGMMVEHVNYPGQTGRVVGKTKRHGVHPLEMLLVKWDNDKNLSRHTVSALEEVRK